MLFGTNIWLECSGTFPWFLAPHQYFQSEHLLLPCTEVGAASLYALAVFLKLIPLRHSLLAEYPFCMTTA